MSKEQITKELYSIMDANGGLLNPEAVVEFAKDETTALHSQFEWDDSKAGHQWRLHQARMLICTVKIEIPDIPTVRALVSLSDERGKEGGYRRLTQVLSDETLRDRLLSEAKREMQTFMTKYAVIKQLIEEAWGLSFSQLEQKFSDEEHTTQKTQIKTAKRAQA